MGPPPGDSYSGPENDTALLRSVLTFYGRFAHRNEANPRLQGEAAWAYFKVGLCEKLGRLDEAKQSITHATEMLLDLAKRFPDVPEYRSKLVQIAIMTDPWSVDPSSLEAVEGQLRELAHSSTSLPARLPRTSTTFRLKCMSMPSSARCSSSDNQLALADASYRRADRPRRHAHRAHSGNRCRPGGPGRCERGPGVSARTARSGRPGAGSARSCRLGPGIATWTRPGSPIADRFESLAEAFRSLGDTRRADEVARLASGPGRRMNSAAVLQAKTSEVSRILDRLGKSACVWLSHLLVLIRNRSRSGCACVCWNSMGMEWYEYGIVGSLREGHPARPEYRRTKCAGLPS